jgi:hypothetical protein
MGREAVTVPVGGTPVAADDLAGAAWRRRDEVVWRYVGDGIVLLNVDDAGLTVLDEAGAVVWQELRARRTTDELCSRVATRVGSTAALVGEDVRRVLSHLAVRALVERADD